MLQSILQVPLLLFFAEQKVAKKLSCRKRSKLNEVKINTHQFTIPHPHTSDDATQSQSLPVQTKDNKPDTNEDEIEKDANVTSDVDMPSSDEEESCEEEESSSD